MNEFLWGAATSAHQVEGGNRFNDWWRWEEEGHIEGGVRSGMATDHWNRFKEDLRLAADLGLTSYRFSVEWSRIEPEQGVFSSQALGWYEALVAECEKNKLLPMLTLHHFTSPQWLAEKGGFTNPASVDAFLSFTKQVVKKLGARVPLWCTVNEPMVLTAGTYLGQFMPPAVFNPALASAAAGNLFHCHVQAYDAIHSLITQREGPFKHVPVQVGIAHNMIDFLPDRAWHPVERMLSNIFDRYYNQSWIDAILGYSQNFGILGLVPKPPVLKQALGRATADFLGVNYYTKAYVKFWPRDAGSEQSKALPIGLAFARRKELASDLGWAMHPKGLYKMLRRLSQYKMPIYITENGIADRDDDLRPQYLSSHLRQVCRALDEGIDVRGYYYWSLLDNFEWIKGFWPRFGLYQVDFSSFERKPTGSARFLKKVIESQPKGAPPTMQGLKGRLLNE